MPKYGKELMLMLLFWKGIDGPSNHLPFLVLDKGQYYQ